MDPLNTEVKTEDVKSKNVTTKQDYRRVDDLQNTIKRVSFAKQENQVKQDQHEYMDKNTVLALNKLDKSYNDSYINYINCEFKEMTLEYMSQENTLIHQEHAYSSVLLSAYGKSNNVEDAWYHEDTEECEGWFTSDRKEFKDMINRGAWRKSKTTNINPNICITDSKWVFKKKRYGRFRANLFAQCTPKFHNYTSPRTTHQC